MAKYKLTAHAEEDIREIYFYIGANNPAAADAMIEKFLIAFEHLSAFPESGHSRADLTDLHCRFWTVYPYLILYHPDAHPLEIIRVLHGYRDMETLL